MFYCVDCAEKYDFERDNEFLLVKYFCVCQFCGMYKACISASYDDEIIHNEKMTILYGE